MTTVDTYAVLMATLAAWHRKYRTLEDLENEDEALAAAYDAHIAGQQAELAGAVRNLDAVSNGYRWMRALRDGLAERGVSSTQWADVVPNALALIDRLTDATGEVRS